MKRGEMDRFIAHCDKYFQQTDCTVLHPTDREKPHIDALLYKPNDPYPFWKLVTMGASDDKMPKLPNSLGSRNEYMMFIDPSEDLTDPKRVGWYHANLLEVALYPVRSKTAVTYGHSMEWGEEEGSDMVGAFLELPQMIEDPAVLRCKLGLMKQTVCLQVVLLTRKELNMLMEIGPQQFSNYLYPEDGALSHYICERFRTERF